MRATRIAWLSYRHPAVLRTLRNTVLYFVLAAATFVCVAGVIRGFVPWPVGLGLQAKMEYYAAHADEYDTLIIGSSRTVRGLDNSLVEEYLAEAGVELHSFNMAVGGMRTFEQDFVLHEVLASKPASLRRIFFEGGPVGMGLREDHVFRAPPNLETERGVYWHSLGETLNVLGAIRALPLSSWRKVELATTHILLCAWKYSNYGKGETILERIRTSPKRERIRADALRRIAERSGHEGLEQATGRERSREITELLDDPAPFDARMRAIPEENAMQVPFETVHLGVYRKQFAAAAAAGVDLVYFVPPGYEGSPERSRLHEAGEIPVLLDFNDPAKYPELFRLDHRFDKGHLNRAGVVAFSRAFADAVAALDSGTRKGAE